jgi:L-gulonolactone oxidase
LSSEFPDPTDSYRADDQYPQYALEWAIDSADAKACLQELREWLDGEAADPKGLRAHFPLEIRWSSADDIYLSPSYGRETTWIGIVSYRSVLYPSGVGTY